MNPVAIFLENAVKSLLLFCVFTLPLLVSRLFFRPFETPRDALLVCSMACCAAGMFAAALVSPEFPLFRKSRLTAALGCYAVYTALNAVMFPYVDRVYFLNVCGELLLCFVASAVADAPCRSCLLFLLSCVALLLSLYGASQFFGVALLNPYGNYFGSQLPFGTRIFVTLGNPNLVGGFYALLLPLMAACWVDAIRKGRRGAWWGIVFVCSGIALLMSQTRGSWLCAACALGLFAVMAWKESLRAFIRKHAASVLLLLFVGILGGYAAFRTLETSTKLMTTSSWAQRMGWYETTLQMIRQRPLFGHGIGTFAIYFPLAQDERRVAEKWGGSALHSRVQHPHNEHLELLHDGGIVGYSLFLWGIFEALRALFRRKNLIEYGLAAALTGILLDGMLMQNLRFTVIASLLWLLIGVANHAAPPRSIPLQRPTARCAFTALTTIIIALSFFAIRFEIRLLRAAYYSMEARKCYNAYLPQAALEWYRKAIAFSPNDLEMLYNIGESFEDIGARPQAITMYERLLTLAPYWLDVNFRLGLLFKQEGELRRAKEYFQQQIRIDNLHWESYYQLALLARTQGNRAEAISLLNEILAMRRVNRKLVPTAALQQVNALLQDSSQ